MLPLFLLFASFLGISKSTVIFQGSCSDDQVVCEELCITISPLTYECGCWNEHLLDSDGLSCKVSGDLTQETSQIQQSITPSTRFEETEPVKVLPTESSDLSPPIKFRGKEFAKFPVDDDFYLTSNITLEFRFSEPHNGILVFAGEYNGDDFLSLAIQGPNVVLRYDCGEGTIEDLYHGPFMANKWHSLNVERKYCEKASIQMDEQRRMDDETKQFRFYKGISVDGGLYVGGAPHDVHYLQAKASTSYGFKGCVRKLFVNNIVLLDTREGINKAMNADSLGECSDSDASYYTGDVISNIDEQLNNNKKDDSNKNTQRRPEVREIVLHTGMNSEEHEETHKVSPDESLSLPSEATRPVTTSAPLVPATRTVSPPPLTRHHIVEFGGNSHISLNPPQDALQYMELVIHFKPYAQDGVLFVWECGNRYLLLSLQKGFLHLDVSLGSDTTTLSSAHVVAIHQWHKAEVWRTGRGILLKLNHEPWVESELAFQEDLTLPTSLSTLTLGGGALGDLPANAHIGGFSGCIKNVLVNGVRAHLSDLPSSNVRECGSDPCAASQCPGVCVSRNQNPECLCPWPRYGNTCEHESEKVMEAISFDGNSYLEFESEDFMQFITGDHLQLAIEFKVSNRSGGDDLVDDQILAFAGSSKHKSDYLRLLVSRDNAVRFILDLGAGPIDITHPTTVKYDTWHTVEIIREKQTVKFSLDGMNTVTAVTPEGSEQFNVYHSFFAGGVNEAEVHMTGLHGCIQMIQIGNRVVRHPSDASAAFNVRECKL